MTDTTNDAPVTVEQAAARLHRAIDLLVWTRSNRKAAVADANEMWGELEDALHAHRLAALASAPADPYPLSDAERAALQQIMQEQELSAPAVWRQALRSYQMDHERRKAGETVTWSGDAGRAREFAGPLASAPAGDGVEAALKFALTVKAELVERAPTYSIQSVEREHFDRAILAIAALARPRAAVGERADDVGLAEAVRDLLDAQKRLGPAVTFRLDLWECLEAILADRP